jgi:hypothetical protein
MPLPPTTNMNLSLPTPTVTLGPTYAAQNNSAFTAIDSHSHIPGQGVPIPSNGISINGDLPFNGFNASLLRSTRFGSQSAALALPGDVSSLYVVGGNLYYNNSVGQAIQLTSGSALNAASIGAIGGDYATSTASEFYTSAAKTFTFWSSTNFSALLDSSAITIRPLNVASAAGVTLTAPPTLSASYGLTFPLALPASTKIATVDSSGNVGVSYDVDNSTLQVVSNLLQVPTGGIGTAQLAAGAVTKVKMGALGQQVSSSSGVFSSSSTSYVDVTNLTVTITTFGRPVRLFLQYDGVGTAGACLVARDASFPNCTFKLLRGATTVALVNMNSAGTQFSNPPSAINHLDFVAAGTYTYKLQMINNSSGTNTVQNCVLVAYEE